MSVAMRMHGLMLKEIKQIIRDPSAILIAFLMPVVLLIVNGFGISFDANHMKVAVVIAAPEESVRGMLQALKASPYLDPIAMADTHAAEAAVVQGDVRGMLVVREDFSQRMARSSRWPAPAELAVNATDPNTARILEGYISGALGTWLGGQSIERRLAVSGDIELQHRYWFNPELRSADAIVPGIIAMIMTMTGTLLTALIVAREWERGTMESMLASPAGMAELIFAKLGCYFVLGMGSMAMSVLMAIGLFGLPFRGGIPALMAASALFLVFALGLGIIHFDTCAQPVRRGAGGVPRHDAAGDDAVRDAVRYCLHAALAANRYLRCAGAVSGVHSANPVPGRRRVGGGDAQPAGPRSGCGHSRSAPHCWSHVGGSTEMLRRILALLAKELAGLVEGPQDPVRHPGSAAGAGHGVCLCRDL